MSAAPPMSILVPIKTERDDARHISLYDTEGLLARQSAASKTSGRPQMHLGRLIRDRIVGQQQAPSWEKLKVKELRESWFFDRKLNIILRNPEMFRRYKQYALDSGQLSPSGLCHVLNEFMERLMTIANILEDIEREGKQPRCPTFVVSALDKGITFDDVSEDLSLSLHSASSQDRSPVSPLSSPTSDFFKKEPNMGGREKTKEGRLNSMVSYETDITLPSLDQSDDSSDESNAASPLSGRFKFICSLPITPWPSAYNSFLVDLMSYDVIQL
jgi:hypothetical protein